MLLVFNVLWYREYSIVAVLVTFASDGGEGWGLEANQLPFYKHISPCTTLSLSERCRQTHFSD